MLGDLDLVRQAHHKLLIQGLVALHILPFAFSLHSKTAHGAIIGGHCHLLTLHLVHR